MENRTAGTVQALEDQEPPRKRSDALPYIGYKSLLCTSRAVRHQRVTVGHGGQRQVFHDLILSFAGGREDLDRDNLGERTKRLRYLVGKHAKEGMHLQIQNLRKARTDYQFNQIQIAFLTAVRDAQIGAVYEHVHDCAKAGAGEPCTFDWSPHVCAPDGPECFCSPSLGDLNMQVNPPVRFVIHKGEEI